MPPDAITVLIPCQDNWELIESTISQLAPYFSRRQRQLRVMVFDNASRELAPKGWPLTLSEADTDALTSVQVVRLAKRLSRAQVVGFGLQYAQHACEPGAVMVLEMEGRDRPGDVAGVLSAFEKGHCQVVFPAGKGWLGRLRARWSARLARIPLRWLSAEIPEVGSFRLRPRLRIGPVVGAQGPAAPGFSAARDVERRSHPGFLARWLRGMAWRSPQLSALMLAVRPHLAPSLQDPQLDRFILTEEICYERSSADLQTAQLSKELAKELAEVPPFPSTEFQEVASEPTDVNQLGNLIRAIGFADGHGEDLTALRRRMLQQEPETRPVDPPRSAEPAPSGMSPVGVGSARKEAPGAPPLPQAIPAHLPTHAEARARAIPTMAAPERVPTARPMQATSPVSRQQPERHQPAPQQSSPQDPARRKISIPRVHVPNVRVPAASPPAVAQSADPAPAAKEPTIPAVRERRISVPASANGAARSVTERMRASLAQSAGERAGGPAGRSAIPMFPAASSASPSTASLRRRRETAPIQPSPARMRVSVPRDLAIGVTNGLPAAPRPGSGPVGAAHPAHPQNSLDGASAAAHRRPIVGNPAVAIPPKSNPNPAPARPTRFRQTGSAPVSSSSTVPVSNGPGTPPPAAPKPAVPGPTGSNPGTPSSAAMDVVRRLRAMRGESQ